MIRYKLDQQLQELNEELVQMGSMCEKIIVIAKDTVRHKKTEEIEASDLKKEISLKGREIETIAMRILLQQQPVARDLRFISASMKIVNDLNRIADQALNIAEMSTNMKKPDLIDKTSIASMSKYASKMVSAAVLCFTKSDTAMTKDVILQDDQIDELFWKTKDTLIELITSDKEDASDYIDLLMIAKYFEKIGDHCVNISKWIYHVLEGSHTSSKLKAE